jgi:ribonuclease P protein component
MRGEEYLTKPRQFTSVYSQGISRTSKLVSMKVLPNNLDYSRYGFSVSKRVGKAVTRNKIKRRFRECLRTMPIKPGWDIVFVARPPLAEAEYTSLRMTVENLLERADLLETEKESSSSEKI